MTTKAAYLLLDTETTGLDHNKNAIIEIGALPLTRELELASNKVFHVRVQPYEGAEISHRAIEVNGHTWALNPACDEYQAAIPAGDLWLHLRNFMRDAELPDSFVTLVGWNISFDERFLRKACGNWWPFFHLMDGIGIARFADAKLKRFRQSYKLDRMVEDLVDAKVASAYTAHSALGDCYRTLEVLKTLLK